MRCGSFAIVYCRPQFVMVIFFDPKAAPADRAWHVQWSSEAPAYGGHGMIDVLCDGVWTIPARCCLLLRAGAEENE